MDVGQDVNNIINHGWNQWKWEGFLKNRENWKRREDTSVLVNRAVGVTMVGLTVSFLPSVLFGHKKSCTQSRLQVLIAPSLEFHHSIYDMSLKLPHHFVKSDPRLSESWRDAVAFSARSQQLLSSSCVMMDWAKLFLRASILYSPRKIETCLSSLLFSPFFVSARYGVRSLFILVS